MRFSTTLYSLLLVQPAGLGLGGFGLGGVVPGGVGLGGFGFLPEAAAAQAVDVDQGIFVVYIGGRAVGTERFRIMRRGFGDNALTIAQGSLDIVQDGSRHAVESRLGALGGGMLLDAYEVEVSLPSEVLVRLQLRGDRMVSETTSQAGVEEREYREALPQTPTVVLDRFFAHHYFFLAPFQTPSEANLSAILPRPGGQSNGTLRMTAVERITVGPATIQAQRLELRLDGAVHDIWLDSQNRVLRVEIPSQDYVAERQDPPPG